MAKVRKRIKKTSPNRAAASASPEPVEELTLQEKDQSRRFLTLLIITAVLFVMMFIVFQVVKG